jgi:hypothetical protein
MKANPAASDGPDGARPGLRPMDRRDVESVFAQKISKGFKDDAGGTLDW